MGFMDNYQSLPHHKSKMHRSSQDPQATFSTLKHRPGKETGVLTSPEHLGASTCVLKV